MATVRHTVPWAKILRGLRRGFQALAVTLLLNVVFVLRPEQAFSREDYVFSVGRWVGSAVYDDTTNKFNYCGITRDYQQTSLYIAIGNTGEIVILMTNPYWQLGTRDYPLTFQIDRRLTRTGDAEGEGETIAINFGQDWELLQALRRGRNLYVRSQGQTLTFDLKDTFVALQRTFECVSQRSAVARLTTNPFAPSVSQNPFGSPPTPYQAPQERLTADQLGTLKIILYAAGLDNVTLLSRAEMDKLGWTEDSGFLAAWADFEKGLVGAIAVLPRYDPRTTLSEILKGTGQECAGEFATIQQEINTVSGIPIGRARTYCSEFDKTTVLDFALFFEQDGTVMFINGGLDHLKDQIDEISEGLIKILTPP